MEAALALDAQTKEAHYYLALVYSKEQKFDDATREFEAEVTNNPNFADARYELGKLLLQRDGVALAVNNLEIAVKLEPENAAFHDELARAYNAAGRREDARRTSEIVDRLRKQSAP